MASKVIESLLGSERFQALQHALKTGDSILCEELWNSPKALIAALAQQVTGKHVVILTAATQEEAKLYHDFSFFTDRPVVDFPAWETLPSDQIAPSPDIVGDRYKVLRALATAQQPHIVLTNLQACLQKVLPPKVFQEQYLSLNVGDSALFELLILQLEEMGYHRQSVASDKGEFAVRGGIVDVFPVSTPEPYRIEFWGDEISSIRTFDPIGQQSIQLVKSVEIPPGEELQLLKQQSSPSTLLDYLGTETLVIFDDLLALEDRYASLVNMGGAPTAGFSSLEELLDRVMPLQKIFWTSQPIEELSKIRILEKLQGGYYSESAPLYTIEFEIFQRKFPARRWQNPFVAVGNFLLPEIPPEQPVSGEEVLNSLRKLAETDYRLHFLCASEAEESTLKRRLSAAQIPLPHHTVFDLGYLSSGFLIPDIQCIWMPYTEISQRYKIRRQKQRSTYHSVTSEFFDLTPGETIVHLNHGIGRYLGIQKRTDHTGALTEFFQVEYADKAQLYVPVQQANLLNKYIGATETTPTLHTLGSGRWKRIKEQTEKAIRGYAQELLELYAKRSMKQGFVYPEDSVEMRAFEEDFPFEETEDQKAAIEAIRKDMTSLGVMDRLVCGDVGYGKTEVAMRAAFKAVVDGGKQVAILVPTTVLAMQHYETFKERTANFPINVALLSRFSSAKEGRQALEGVKNGSVDVLVGTHKILSKDVEFKNLGLIIIDEEQRFGVRAKEALKKIKLDVDCLALSATPIPRTLYMSLVGARDISVISTPPQDRLPITTVIAEPHDQVLKNALMRELARDGQAFYIHNRVETIFGVVERIKTLLPQARVAVAHGQMHADEIDAVFHAFKSGKVDILVATTIIENGIDIPNANTILIEDADRHFGMADLYQLRGRVGRWNRRAYAYFLVRYPHRLPEISRKRLEALAETSGYGGGMKVAMRDLENRGAGDMLGVNQSGHVAAVGFHLYCKMLKRTIHAYQGNVPQVLTDTKLEFPFDARLPEEYIEDLSLRLDLYQRLGEAMTLKEVDAINKELVDRFGPLPKPAQWLYHTTRLRVFASINHFTWLKIEKITLLVERKQGSQETETRRFVIGSIESPAAFETAVTNVLNKEFCL